LWLMENETKRNENENENLADAIRAGAREARDKPALVVWSSVNETAVASFTFSEFMSSACAFKNGLLSASVRKGARVAILSHPTPSYFYSVAGLWLIGAIPVNLPPRQSLPNLQHMTSLVSCTTVLASSHFVETGVAGKLLVGGTTVFILDAATKSQYEIRGTQTVAAALGTRAIPLSAPAVEGGNCIEHDGENDDGNDAAVACIMFTSGSTGKPKGVPLTHKGLLWSCRAKLAAHGGMEAVKLGTLSFLTCSHVVRSALKKKKRRLVYHDFFLRLLRFSRDGFRPSWNRND
jgi:long-chain acyl-CoA synthetase